MWNRFSKNLNAMSEKEHWHFWLRALTNICFVFSIFIFFLSLSSGRTIVQAFVGATSIGLMLFILLALTIKTSMVKAEKIKNKAKLDARNLAHILKSMGIESYNRDSEVVFHDPITKKTYSFIPKRFKNID